MNKYKYFQNVKKNAVFTEQPCQYCGKSCDCLEGVYFERNNVESICLDCFVNEKNSVYIPDYIRNKVVNDSINKVKELSYTPPVAWIQNNEWPVCCDDFMKYMGEWEKENLIEESNGKDVVEFFKSMLAPEMINRIDDIEILIDDLGYESAAYVFKCIYCNKIVIVCQDY